MAKSKNRHDLMEEIEGDPFLDDPEAEVAEAEITEEAVVADETAALRAEIADLKDRLLRALGALAQVLGIGERDRALDNATDVVRETAPGLVEGIELTRRELLNAFERNKIQKVEPRPGERFDPKLHQAMFEAPVPGTKAGDIIQVMSPGFTIADRLLRPAQVGVSAGGPAMPSA